MATCLYSFLLYHAFILIKPLKYKSSGNIRGFKRFGVFLAHCVALNVISGVTVAGIDAGKVFNTWPSMNGKFLPDGYYRAEKGWKNMFENCATVQFNHRCFAYLTYLTSLAMYCFYFNKALPCRLRFAINLTFFLVNL